MQEEMLRNLKKEEEEKKQAEDSYNAELAILKAEQQQRTFLSLLDGFRVSNELENYVEMPNGKLLVDDNNLPGLSSDINLVKGTYGEGYREASDNERKHYDRLKKRMQAGYMTSFLFKTGAKVDELQDTVIDGLVDTALDIPLLVQAPGQPLLS